MTYFRLFACLAPLVCNLGLAQSASPVKTAPPQAQRPSFALAAGRLYEHLGEWEKAEAEYLKAGGDAAPAIQREIFDSLVRVRQALKVKNRHDALLAARSLERQERWKEAEQAYVDLLKSDPAVESEVTDALKRLQPRMAGKRWAEAFDEIAGKAGRGLLLVTIGLAVWIAAREIKKTRRSIQFLPFRASSDTGAKQIAFWVRRVHAELRSPATPFSLSPALFSGLPFVRMPDLPEQAIEPVEFEVGGVKLSMKQVTELVSAPRVRVSCEWIVGSVAGDAFAEVERRKWIDFEAHSMVARSIASNPGDAQDRDLRLFAYDVFIKAGNAYGS